MMRMSTTDLLTKLAADIASRAEPDFAAKHRFLPGAAVPEEALAAREAELELRFPPSYRDFVREHGRFTLGDPVTHGQLAFKLLPLEEHRSALVTYAEQLDCEPTAAAVASEIGMDEEVVGVLAEIILVGLGGHEDYVGFDLRTRNEETGECAFGSMLFEDGEIEACSQKETPPCEGRGFDAWLAKHLARRVR
jgi:hypothetical protein